MQHRNIHSVIFSFRHVYSWIRPAVMAALLSLLWTGADAEIKTFTFTPPTARSDGTPFDAQSEQKESLIYCNGTLLARITGSANTIQQDMPAGVYSCTATTVDHFDQESVESPPVNFTVLPAAPAAGVLEVT